LQATFIARIASLYAPVTPRRYFFAIRPRIKQSLSTYAHSRLLPHVCCGAFWELTEQRWYTVNVFLTCLSTNPHTLFCRISYWCAFL